METIKLKDLTQRDIALLDLLVFRLKQEGVIGSSYKLEDLIDIILKRGDYEVKK